MNYQPGGEFVISARKLLPKIPMHCPPDQLKYNLGTIQQLRDDVIKLAGKNWKEIRK